MRGQAVDIVLIDGMVTRLSTLLDNFLANAFQNSLTLAASDVGNVVRRELPQREVFGGRAVVGVSFQSHVFVSSTYLVDGPQSLEDGDLGEIHRRKKKEVNAEQQSGGKPTSMSGTSFLPFDISFPAQEFPCPVWRSLRY
ncbi:hypothetical protein PAXINDRAFT_103932 [Paxillus involutus ATCC 200175]|uniref:Uncharacterized protein n=1 Tax=Paxillus involutus ATCC 200175 TaxID=664439 RepID=A0A0C9SSZ9_PAXIN|nr:hypothetical protein PAXINDRAFT_103932 [Paxillus involutus ATCC 200175]